MNIESNFDRENEYIFDRKIYSQKKKAPKRTDFLHEKTREVFKDYCVYLENNFSANTDLIAEKTKVPNSTINYDMKFFVKCVMLDRIRKGATKKEEFVFYYNRDQDPDYELLKKQFMKMEDRKDFVEFLRG